MLARPGELPTGNGWAYEVKWDGFRAIVSTEDGLRVHSRHIAVGGDAVWVTPGTKTCAEHDRLPAVRCWP